MNAYFWYRSAKSLSLMLPRSAAYGLGKLIADCFFAADGKGRAAVMANLRRISGHLGADPAAAGLRRMARRTFRNFGKYLVDFFRFDEFSAARGLATMENEEFLHEALAEKRGVIVVTAHYGNWELAGAMVAAKGVPITAVAFPLPVGKSESLFREQRARRGLNALTFGAAARAVLKALKRGELVAMLADRDFTRHRSMLPFFGRPARLPVAPARLSLLSGAPVLPAFMRRLPDESFLLRFYRRLAPGGNVGELQIREYIRDCMEREIGADPSQWFIFEKFWQDRPGQ